MAGLIAAVLVSSAAGFAMTSRVVFPGTSRASLCTAAALAVGMGIGVTGCAFFAWTALVGPAVPGYAVVELLLLAGITVVLRRKIFKTSTRWLAALPHPARRPVGWIWLAVAGASLAVALNVFVVRSLRDPHGGWDAWMTWNVAARFLSRGQSHWQDAFSPSFRHPDYPWLLPASVGRLWTWMGTESVMAPAAIAMLFTLATVGLAGASLALLRTERQAILAILTLVGTRSLITYGAAQYADIPLAFFMFATIVLFFLSDRAEPGHRLIALAGIAAGFAAWTKNEGQLFIVAIIVARCAAISIQHGWRAYMNEVPSFAVGLAPVLAIVVYFKVHLAPANEFVAGQGLSDTLPRLLDIGRYLAVAAVFKTETGRLGYNGLVGLIPVLVVYLLVVGLRIDPVDRPALVMSLITVVLVLTGYVLVLVTAPGDFLRLLNRSVDRLLLHVWPIIVFVTFMVARPPEEAID
jgi:hypothetical protein